MKLSNTNAKILLVEANRIIEKYADSDATKIVEKKDFNFMCYPPNCGFSDAEKIELGKLDNNEALKSALRKLFANNSATVLFHLFNIIDETGDPQGENSAWTGVKMKNMIPPPPRKKRVFGILARSGCTCDNSEKLKIRA